MTGDTSIVRISTERTAQRIAAHMRRNGEYIDRGVCPNLTADKALNHILDTFI